MSQNYSNFLKLNGELGYKLLPRLWVAGTLDFRLPAKNGPFFNTEAYRFTGTYLNDQMYLGAGVKASYDLVPDKVGLSGSRDRSSHARCRYRHNGAQAHRAGYIRL